MRTSIAARIRRALIGLALGLSAVFSALMLLLMYITEDQIFVNELVAERAEFLSAPASERAGWRPASRHMQLYLERNELPSALQNAVGIEPGVYEQFDDTDAAFVLVGRLPDTGTPYFLVYDVGPLLAVRTGRSYFLVAVSVVTLIVILIAIVVAMYLARTTLRPLRQLSERLRSGDDLPADFSARLSGDEIGVLASALEAALVRVRASAQREFEFNRGVSHELRSPIQVAANAVELMSLAQDKNAGESAGPLARLRRAVHEMDNVSEAFLWLASDREFDGDAVDGARAARALVDDLRQRWPDRDIRVDAGDAHYAMPAPVYAVVLGNLLRNAIQHSDDGPVTCTLSPHRIVVENSGTHGDDAGDRKGFGVGLDIVKRICERFGWAMTLEEQPSGGVRATLRIQESDA